MGKVISAQQGEDWMRRNVNSILVDTADPPCAWRFNGEDFQLHVSGDDGFGWTCHPPPGRYEHSVQFHVSKWFTI